MALIRPISNASSAEWVFCAITGSFASGIRSATYTDNNVIKSNGMTSTTSPFTISGSDFSCHVGTIDTTLTVKKAGTYEITTTSGATSTQTFAANDTVTVPISYDTTSSWIIRKIS